MKSLALETSKIIAAIDDGIGWLTLNQPEKRNAISLEMWQGIGDALEAFEHDDEVRVVVVTGAGGKAFASGADISEFDQRRANAEQRKEYGRIAARGNHWLGALTKPMIAMIRGYCIGGGLAVALNADIRFATRNSTFGIPAARLGLGYDYGGLAVLARLVGPAVARDMMFSARFLDAEEAQRVGLINFVVDDESLEARVRDYALSIAANAPLTVKAAKASVDAFERYSMTEAAKDVAPLIDACFDSEDYKEGRRAFKEKRDPVFRGR